MPDREKVIKAYEDFVNGYECFCTSDDYEYEMHKAVLALLKEQEPITPHKNLYTPVIPIKCSYECECTAPLIDGQPFCARCGRKVKWE